MRTDGAQSDIDDIILTWERWSEEERKMLSVKDPVSGHIQILNELLVAKFGVIDSSQVHHCFQNIHKPVSAGWCRH